MWPAVSLGGMYTQAGGGNIGGREKEQRSRAGP